MDISFSNELCYMSASRCNQDQDLFFYSAPTSPSRLKLIEYIDSQTTPTTPRLYDYEDSNSNLDGFEFETSHRFSHSKLISAKRNKIDVEALFEQKQRICGDSSPTMAFADELFCDGKVMPLIPLKLPPRLVHNGDGNVTSSTQSSRATSPKSPGSMLRLPFTRLWKNDEFDPFKVALEKIREEKRGKIKGKQEQDGLRRTRSLSPLRVFNKCDKHTEQLESHGHDCDKAELICELLEEPMKEALGREIMVHEPKNILVSNDVEETKKDENKREGFWARFKKGKSIKKFLFGKFGKASSQNKFEDKKETLVKKLDMECVTSTQSTKWSNNDEISGEFSQMRLVCHRPFPKFFLF